jgi:hypothetical protein
MIVRLGNLDDSAVRAIRHLIMARDELEMAGRPDGEIVQITRQQVDAILDDLGVVARLIVGMAGGVR